MPVALIEALAQCQTLEQFYELCAPLGLYASGRRFMQIELDITNRCNLRCVMCYHSFESTRRTKTVHMTPDDFARIATRALPHAHRLSLSLGNEPLMSPHFVDILHLVSTHKVPHVNFFTNGLLLSDEHVAAIIGCGVTQVCVSIDGATPATYNFIRRDGDFDQLVRNVARLVSRRNATGRVLPRVRFDVVMMQRNIHELEDIVDLGARLGIDELAFRHLVSFEGLGVESESLQFTKALSNYWLERALTRAAKFGLAVPTRPEPFDLGGAESDELPSGQPYFPHPYCPFPFFHAAIGPGGHVHACPHAHGEAPYGQVSDSVTLDQIWLGPRFTALRRRILDGDPPDMCRRCPFLADKYPNVAGLFATRRQ